MQEDPGSVPEGETPRSLLLYAFDTNVDVVKPGDKVTITGEWHSFERKGGRQREGGVGGGCGGSEGHALAGLQVLLASMQVICSMASGLQPPAPPLGLLPPPAGIFRASRMRVNPKQRTLLALFKTYLDVLHYERDDSARMFG